MRNTTSLGHFVAVLAVLALSVSVLAEETGSHRQEAAIKDSQDWAGGIIQGLGTLAPPPSALLAQPKASEGGQRQARHSGAKRKAAAQAAAPAAVAPNETRNYEYSQKGRYTEVVIKIKDKVENGLSKNFRINVTSTQPLTGWTIRARGTDTVLAQGGLFGETSFTKLVPQAFRPDFVMNLSVKRDGSDWVDFFKLYNEGTVQSR